jgi:hypothetical protein
MNKLSKIVRIGALALVSLAGCTSRHHIEGDIVKYNETSSKPMMIKDNSEKAVYHATIKWNSLPATGKDISMIYVFENNLSFSPRLLVPYNTKDSAEFNMRIKKFEHYQDVIKSRRK